MCGEKIREKESVTAINNEHKYKSEQHKTLYARISYTSTL
jgi:hypothetical protein